MIEYGGYKLYYNDSVDKKVLIEDPKGNRAYISTYRILMYFRMMFNEAKEYGTGEIKE